MHSTTQHFANTIAPQCELLKSFLNQLKKFQTAIVQPFSIHRFKLQVHQIKVGHNVLWYAFDAKTGKTIYADSQSELWTLIKQSYQNV